MKKDMSVFKKRREHLAQLMDGGALILPAHPEYIRNGDVHHPYRQDTNLYYLTGFEEPESIFIFRPGQSPETVLFVRKRDVERETWDGRRYGPEKAQKEFQMEATYPVEDFEKEAAHLLKDVDKVYYRLFHNYEFDAHFQRVLERVENMSGRNWGGNLPIQDSFTLLAEMRMIKDEHEIHQLRKAGEVSAAAHVDVMRATRPGVTERTLHGIFIKGIMERGAQREGYGSIVASGDHGTILHYIDNNDVCKSGDLLLVDAGGEFNYYTADITRTYPIDGQFTDLQGRIYEKILKIQKHLIGHVAPGRDVRSLQSETVQLLTEVMIEEGLLHGIQKDLIDQKEYLKYYPHGVGHWLGSDVHDAGLYDRDGRPRPLESGMCLTIEPGLYIPQHLEAPASHRGLGIRIEDDVLVTEEGCEVLTRQAPKEVVDLEAVVGKGE